MPLGTKIKICGLKTVEDIININKVSIDYIGYVFATSKRKVSVEQVIEMNKYLKSGIKKVGVFANQSIEEVNYIAEKADLDIIQLHSNEDNAFCNSMIKPVWKSIAVRNSDSLSKMKEYINVEGFLFDTYNENELGGTGKTFNWNDIKNISKEKTIILAGGLTKQNVGEAIKVVNPDIIDVSSSLEIGGVKDLGLIKEFVGEVFKVE